MRFGEFSESLKPSQYRDLVKGWDKKKYADLFGGKYRIYIPLNSSKSDTQKNKINPRVTQEVENAGYKIDDYLKGIASKNENGRVRQIRIGRLLSPETAKTFVNDPVRGAARQSNQIVVISRHPYDIAGMSTDRGWSSCMNLIGGSNRHYVPLDIKSGTIIAYLIDANDKNIKNPKARVLIKPFVNILGNREIALGIESTVYGTAPPEFKNTVSEWVDKINTSRKLNGIFELDPRLYNDMNDYPIKTIGNQDTDTNLESQLQLVLKNPDYIRLIKNPSEEVQLSAVTYNGSTINHIINADIKPSEQVQQLAVTSYGSTINHIINADIKPSEQVQQLAVTSYGPAIGYIINAGIKPSEAVQRLAVTSYGPAIEDIINADIKPSEQVQRLAVTSYGLAIEDIIKAGIKPSEQVQQLAVTQSGYVIGYIIKAGIKPSEQVQQLAVTQSGYVIGYIIDAGIKPSEEVQRLAVDNDGRGYAIGDIIKAGIKPSETVQLKAVSSHSVSIRYIIGAGIIPSESVQLASVMKDPLTIKYIIGAGIKPSESVQLASVMKDPLTIKYIIDAGITPGEEVNQVVADSESRMRQVRRQVTGKDKPVAR